VSVPLRRWEDWERSRLRKMRRQERRRRELERSHPGGFVGGDREFLAPGSARTSQYDGSDTYSLASSDDDHWGGQIGGYNENSMQYPPPPVGLYAAGAGNALAGGTMGGSDLEQMLEMGFDDSPTQTPTGHKGGRGPPGAPRFHLNDGKAGYSPLSRSTSPGPNSALSPTSPSTPRREGEKYGPLGPLDPDSRL
jgi:chitin synthase